MHIHHRDGDQYPPQAPNGRVVDQAADNLHTIEFITMDSSTDKHPRSRLLTTDDMHRHGEGGMGIQGPEGQIDRFACSRPDGFAIDCNAVVFHDSCDRQLSNFIPYDPYPD